MSGLSTYFQGLNAEDQRLYKEKLEQLGFPEGDPYFVEESKSKNIAWKDDVLSWPRLEFGSIYVYLIDSPGFTREALKAYKSLEAYNYYASGWVHQLTIKHSNTGHCIIKGKVNRSQALSEKPHQSWVSFKMADSSIVSAHCTCMAGLGLVCSHVAAIMFKVEAATRLGYNEMPCTSLPCQWNKQVIKKVEGVPVRDIKFQKPKKNVKPDNRENTRPVEKRARQDTNALLEDLRKTSPDAVVFTITNPKLFPVKNVQLPKSLGHLYHLKNKLLNEEELKSLVDIKLSCLRVSEEERLNLETETRSQSASILWHKQRAGRITSSLFYDCLHTNVMNPSKSLVNRILIRQSFSTVATQWGIDNEEKAVASFIKIMELHHVNLQVKRCGFILHDEVSFVGSSPDRLISCDCCKDAVLEVKCPYKFKDEEPCKIFDSSFCLEMHRSFSPVCDLGLRKTHPYFYQVQGQLGVCKRQTCYFLVYTNKGLHIEKIDFDEEFWKNMLEKLITFFKACIMPRLLTSNVITL